MLFVYTVYKNGNTFDRTHVLDECGLSDMLTIWVYSSRKYSKTCILFVLYRTPSNVYFVIGCVKNESNGAERVIARNVS